MKVIIVTGASTGLGLAIARGLINKQKDYHLVLTARKSSLPRFAEEKIFENSKLWIRELDVTSLKQRETLIEEVLNRFERVDVLINNAGIAFRTVMEHVEDAELFKQMQINFYAPLALTRLVLPSMRKHRSGQIINISSVSGMMAMPTMGLYSSSKFALEAMSESLWYEVKPWNIKVSLIEPGFIASEAFTKVPWARKALKAHKKDFCPYHTHYQSMTKFIEKLMKRTLAKPDSVAKKVCKIVDSKRPPLRLSGTWDAQFFFWLRRLLPRSLYHYMLYSQLPNIKAWNNYSIDESVFANFSRERPKVNQDQDSPAKEQVPFVPEEHRPDAFI